MLRVGVRVQGSVTLTDPYFALIRKITTTNSKTSKKVLITSRIGTIASSLLLGGERAGTGGGAILGGAGIGAAAAGAGAGGIAILGAATGGGATAGIGGGATGTNGGAAAAAG